MFISGMDICEIFIHWKPTKQRNSINYSYNQCNGGILLTTLKEKKLDLKGNVWFHFYNTQNQLTELQAKIVEGGGPIEWETEEGVCMVEM